MGGDYLFIQLYLFKSIESNIYDFFLKSLIHVTATVYPDKLINARDHCYKPNLWPPRLCYILNVVHCFVDALQKSCTTGMQLFNDILFKIIIIYIYIYSSNNLTILLLIFLSPITAQDTVNKTHRSIRFAYRTPHVSFDNHVQMLMNTIKRENRV